MTLLDVSNLSAGYHKKPVLRDISLDIQPGEFVAVIGHNGAGKTTMARAIFGLLAPTGGGVTFDGKPIMGRAASDIVRQGIALVPQDKAVFPNLNVRDNLELAAFHVNDKQLTESRVAELHKLFPILAERAKQLAGTLSGGQQRMLSIGIALMQSPKLLILDEPSLGLAPLLVQNMMERIQEINSNGMAIMLIEQNVRAAISNATRIYVMKLGQMVYNGPPEKLHDRSFLMELF